MITLLYSKCSYFAFFDSVSEAQQFMHMLTELMNSFSDKTVEWEKATAGRLCLWIVFAMWCSAVCQTWMNSCMDGCKICCKICHFPAVGCLIVAFCISCINSLLFFAASHISAVQSQLAFIQKPVSFLGQTSKSRKKDKRKYFLKIKAIDLNH